MKADCGQLHAETPASERSLWSAAETPAQPQPGGEGLAISRTAPCLLPELQHVCDLPSPFCHDILACICSQDHPAKHGPALLSRTSGKCFIRKESIGLGGCLQVAEVQVKGPRYWQQRVAAGPEGAGPLGALYGRGALPVQLQRWALSYTQDPSGVRGLLSQAFDEVCERTALCDQACEASQ